MRMLTLVAATAILFSASPAVFAASPVMPGEACSNVGASRMSEDEHHILACLRTNDPNRPLVWKSSTSGGGGITGGGSRSGVAGGFVVWGRGCYVHQDRTISMSRSDPGFDEAVEENRQAIANALDSLLMVEPGYSCGLSTYHIEVTEGGTHSNGFSYGGAAYLADTAYICVKDQD